MRYILLLFFCVSSLFSAEKKTICLNMIVKDEKDVIERCLNSVKPIIDYWVVVDTGSMDGTQDIIKDCMKDIPGELHERPWKNFAHNRNEALDFARSKADYVLIMDADDMLRYDQGFTLPELSRDAYEFQISYGSMTYYRPQLINMKKPWVWQGVLHEALVCPCQSTHEKLEGVTYVVSREGARSKDPQKFKKDAAVLEAALKDEPNNTRYVFYLAQTYRDAGEFEKALTWYKKRIEMGGWEEELYFSLYQVAHLEEVLKKPFDDIVSSYYKAYRFRPHRPEAPYHLANLFREHGQHDLAYSTIKAWELIPQPKNPDVLFVESWIEHYGFLIERSISSFYVGRFEESLHDCDTLLALDDLPEFWRAQIEKNRQYPLEKLQAA
jgi:glycosyltransferase involved in cell wall biosynthesis